MTEIEAAIARKLSFSGISRFHSGCDGKVQHDSEEIAKKHAKVMHKRMKKRFDAYLCRFCDKWHVGTHRPGLKN